MGVKVERAFGVFIMGVLAILSAIGNYSLHHNWLSATRIGMAYGVGTLAFLQLLYVVQRRYPRGLTIVKGVMLFLVLALLVWMNLKNDGIGNFLWWHGFQ